jgi:hypothetical protein
MFVTKEELAIEVAEINGIQVDDMNFTKPGQDEVLQQLAADTACAHQKDFGLFCVSRRYQRTNLH